MVNMFRDEFCHTEKKKLFNYIRMKQNSNRQENQIVFMRIIIIKKN